MSRIETKSGRMYKRRWGSTLQQGSTKRGVYTEQQEWLQVRAGLEHKDGIFQLHRWEKPPGVTELKVSEASSQAEPGSESLPPTHGHCFLLTGFRWCRLPRRRPAGPLLQCK